jgi:hypothetical protein
MNSLTFYYNYPHDLSAFELFARQLQQQPSYGLSAEADEFALDVYVLVDQPQSSIIAIDFDSTITEDPNFYRELIITYQQQGWHPVICTLREDSLIHREEILTKLGYNNIQIYFTDGEYKQAYLQCQQLDVCLWIDDYYPSIADCDAPLFFKNQLA